MGAYVRIFGGFRWKREALKGIRVLLLILAAAALLDLATALHNISKLGLSAELNPLAVYIFVTLGPLGLAVAKLSTVAFASVVAIYLVLSGQVRVARATLIVGCIVTMFAALTNVWT